MKGVTDCRVATGLISHPKKLKLQRRLGKQAVWSLIALWSFTAANRPDGSLAGMTAEDIAIAADWDGDSEQFVITLLELRFLDKQGDEIAVHDWADNNPWAAGSSKRSEDAKLAALIKHHGKDAARMLIASASHAVRTADVGETPAPRMQVASEAHAESANPQCPVSISVSNSDTDSEALPNPIPDSPPSALKVSEGLPSENAVREPNVFDRGIALLERAGEKKASARTFIAGLCKQFGDPAVMHAIDTAEAKDPPPVDPKAWLRKVASEPPQAFNGKRKSTAIIGDQPYDAGWGAAA